MSDIYDEAKALAAEMLAPRSMGGNGLELSLVRVTTGEYDPDLGSSPVTTVQYDGSGFRENYRQQDIDGTRIKQGDVKLLISPVLLNGADMPQPISQDKILFDGDTYTVQNVGIEASERGLPAGVYHGRFSTLTGGLTVNDAAQLLYAISWEERPAV